MEKPVRNDFDNNKAVIGNYKLKKCDHIPDHVEEIKLRVLESQNVNTS